MSSCYPLLLILFSSLTVASAAMPARADAPTAPKRLTSKHLEERIQFSYASADGEFGLACKHWIANPGAGDFTVICGKGTPTVKEYSVHLVVREHPRKNATTFEILYWVTDRNAKDPNPEFKSHSQMLTVNGTSSVQNFIMSLGLENDATQLNLKYAP